ncbi:hypothetical protein IP88_09635 [alpha proteobacterium AAP81b]|nr:hypothetical protein IP88_09635 [alpha proteobacterium AAP81b]
MRLISFAAIALVISGPAAAAPIPEAVAKMIDAAAGDPAQLATIAEIAKRTNPDAVAEIDARVAALTKAQADAREAKLAGQGFFDGWSGSGEAGAFTTSGNTRNTGIAVGATVTKESRKWKHKLRAMVDYQRQSGVTTKERYFAGYEGNYNITPRLYALVTLSYDRDPFSGFNSRFSESLGLGYRLIDRPNLGLSLEGGPAVRQTRFTDGRNDNRFAGRIAGDFRWQITPILAFTETASLFADSGNTSLMSLTALTAKLGGDFSARLSFQLNTESNPPLGRANEDTISRVTLVYGF